MKKNRILALILAGVMTVGVSAGSVFNTFAADVTEQTEAASAAEGGSQTGENTGTEDGSTGDSAALMDALSQMAEMLNVSLEELMSMGEDEMLTRLAEATGIDKETLAASMSQEGNAQEAAEEGGSGSGSSQSVDLTTGSPWIYSSVVGALLPEEQQSEKNDFYQAKNYTWLAEHQDTTGQCLTMTDAGNSLKECIMSYLSDESNSSELTENINILYNQVADAETLAEQGIEPVQKYLDMIDNASTIDELSAVLASEDYPFDAFVCTYISAHYNDGNNIVRIDPHFFAVTDMDGAGLYRDYPVDFNSEKGIAIINYASEAVIGFYMLGYNLMNDMQMFKDLIQLEAFYGKDAAYSSEAGDVEYGGVASICSYLTLEEVQERMGAFPITEILAKTGRDGSEEYQIADAAWMDSFASVYTDENLDSLKLIAKLQLLKEVKPYTALVYAGEGLFSTGTIDVSEVQQSVKESNGYSAITVVNTFSHAIASIFKEEILTENDYERLYNLAAGLVDVYKEAIAENEWLDEESKADIMMKLENMSFNILEPLSGYISFDGVKLITTEEGGTAVENYIILKKHFIEETNKFINTPANPTAVWYVITPTMENAFYDPDSNSINIIPGIVNDVTYRADMSDEELYGAIGAIVAHEISHSLDYAGSQFNYKGQPTAVISSDNIEMYLANQQKFIDYLNSIVLWNDTTVNGKKIIVEAVADLAGLEMVHRLAASNENFDYDLFYSTFANLYAASLSQYFATMLYTADNHPENYLRVNVMLQMFEKFCETYDINEGDGMYLAPEDRITIW